jgi:hypothetical protein
MPLASSSYSYPLLGAFWTIFIIFLWVIWIWTLVWIFIDIFRSQDLSGWSKALWFLFVLLIPLIGVVVYLIARGDSMTERTARQAQQQGAYVQEAVADSPANTADQLAKLADLRDRGVISAQEFERQKAKVLAALPRPAHLWRGSGAMRRCRSEALRARFPMTAAAGLARPAAGMG